MALNPVVLSTYGQTLTSLQELLRAYPFHGFPIVNNSREQLLYGYISRANLEQLVEEHCNRNGGSSYSGESDGLLTEHLGGGKRSPHGTKQVREDPIRRRHGLRRCYFSPTPPPHAESQSDNF